MMKKILFSFLLLLYLQTSSLSMTQNKLYRLMSEAQNETAFYAIEYYCADENPGLTVDSIEAEKLHYSRSCQCAIKAGKVDNDYVAKEILDHCGL